MKSSASAGRDGSQTQQTQQRISRWFNRALTKSGLNRRAAAPSPPPPLPSPRPRPITPSDSLPCHPQTQSSLFSRLPLEIRREILLHTFGNRTMHVQLTLDRPMPFQGAELASGGHFGHGGFTQARNVQAPRQWFWRSCVCHRNAPWSPPQDHHTWNSAWYKPDIDTCMQGQANCGKWLGKPPCSCRVGALGWLLSCRQA